MPTMVVKTEVEATPALVLEQLAKFLDTLKDSQFPWPRGAKLMMKPEYLKGIGGVEGMPVMVVMSQKGCQFGMVAIHKTDGDVTMTLCVEAQIDSLYQG